VRAARADTRKRTKLEDDFTPRLELTVVALEGRMHREVTAEAKYRFGDSAPYVSQLTVVPHSGEQIAAPELGHCKNTGLRAPRDCLGRCDVTGAEVLRHLLVRSEISTRHALPEHTVHCSLSGKRILADEAERSALTGKPVAQSLLKTCFLTGKRAEPEHFGRCEFSGMDILSTGLGISDVSGKRYRLDQQLRSAVSGKAGHKDEFLLCHETRQPMMRRNRSSAERPSNSCVKECSRRVR